MPNFATRLGRLYVRSFAGLPRKVWLLSFVMVVNRSGAMVIAFLSVYLVNSMGYSATAAGWVMGAFGAGGIVGNYVGGLLNDRFGSWHIMLVSLVVAGFFHILIGQISGFWPLCILVFFTSMVADAFRPANRAAIAVYAPPKHLTQAYGLQRLAANLGFSIGPALGGLLIAVYGYESLFWADGLTFLLAAALFVVMLPPDETARPLVSAAPASSPSQIVLEETRPGLRQPWLVRMILANACVITCFFQFFSTVPVYLTQQGYTEGQFGLLLTISGVTIVLIEMPLVYLADRRYRPLYVMLAGTALVLAGYLILPLAVVTGYAMLVVWILLITLGEILFMPFTSTYVAKHAPPARRGEYLGLLSASFSLAFVLTPVVGFQLAEYFGYVFSIYAVSGMGIVGFLILLTVDRAREVRTRELALR
ncbi:putative MFS family arabinose efflux permease [Neolewinella xylanilytica]|uniref:Putative MFS family arabinose efflux permease n=1 Tax=Neolewinella xylanilytica TaxID=1514080 RepID=A0A2S6I7H5_9BACT|nr:MFS transporter [Neolewinella xylanilytica]PPK87418.1 putative MFS family arabinose efflux permease [Neolewinella xylanilytica]